MPSTLLSFEKLQNVRDLTGMRTPDGRTIRPGKLIRSGHLADLGETDRDSFTGKVSVIIDFRSNIEKDRQPDKRIPGAEYHHIPIVEDLTAGITREKESDARVSALLLLRPGEAKDYMCRMYSSFAKGRTALGGYRKFIRLLQEPREGAVLWHCTAGKDRAGIGAVLIEELLGISRDDIMEDYLRTREYIAEDILFLTAMIKKQHGTDSSLADEALGYLFGAEEDYLQAFYDTVEQEYGSVEDFLERGLGISRKDRTALQEMYLC